MQLKKLEMNNFRQFYGKQSIDFATGEKNTTVILGNNNTGKTGLYRAVMFGLYGLRKLEQDSSHGNIHLVNFKALEENSIVYTSVTVTLETPEGEFIITRKISGSNVQGTIKESTSNEVLLDFKDKYGEYHTNYRSKPQQIRDVINEILDENIKEFFLFDGEKIETLARGDNISRDEVKKGIVKLMEIDKLDQVKEIVRSIYNSEKSSLARKSADIELEKIQKEIENTNFQIEKSDITKKEVEANLLSINQDLDNIEEEMKKNQANFVIVEEKISVEKDLKYTLKRFEMINEKMSEHLFDNLSPLILSDYTMNLNSKLKNKMLKQDDLIPMHVLTQTLENNICLCCNQDIKDLERNYINILLKDYKYSRLTPILNNISRNLDNFNLDREKYLVIIKKDLNESSILKTEILDYRRQLEVLEGKMLDVNQSQEVLKGLSNRQILLESQKIEATNKLAKLQLNLSDLQVEMNKLESQYTKSIKQNEELKYEMKRLEFIQSIDDKLNRRYNEYVFKTRKILGEKTTETFKGLIDYKNQSLVKNIEINERYEMDVKYIDDLNVTLDISQGQQMIVALSFITALASIASKNTNRLDYPLFMDSPFGRLSKVNRKNLIQNLPNLTNQWIPLLTDSDYTSYEQSEFDKTRRVGKIYNIKKISEDYSTIEDITNNERSY